MKQSLLWCNRVVRLVVLTMALGILAGEARAASDSVEDNVSAYRRDVIFRLRKPMAEGMNVTTALTAWFDAAKADDPAGQLAQYKRAIEALREVDPLPKATWPANPTGVTLTMLDTVEIPDVRSFFDVSVPTDFSSVECRIVSFTVDNLKQYGVVLRPKAAGKYPLILYMHGAAFGVPAYQLPWLAQFAARGYVVAAPALRGEDLFAMQSLIGLEKAHDYKSEGQIENLVGEVDDALGMVDGAFKLDYVQPGKFAMIGHSFGAGVGLLVTARSDQVACAISYDAWLVNPFRYYWDRLSGGPNNWLSWEQYCDQPVADQLTGLMARSIVHNAGHVHAPLLLMIGGAYNGSVFHQSHDDLVTQLKAAKKTFRYEIIPGGGHNFVLYPNEEPARQAAKLQDEWLTRYLPPAKPAPVP